MPNPWEVLTLFHLKATQLSILNNNESQQFYIYTRDNFEVTVRNRREKVIHPLGFEPAASRFPGKCRVASMPIGCVTYGSIVAAPPRADKTHQSHPRFPRSARRVEQVRLNEWFVRNAAAVPAPKLELERAQIIWASS